MKSPAVVCIDLLSWAESAARMMLNLSHLFRAQFTVFGWKIAAVLPGYKH